MPRKTVLIIGRSDNDIGSGLALTFQARNYCLRSGQKPSKMTRLAGLPSVTLLSLDVCKSAEITAAVEAAKSHTGYTSTLDYLTTPATGTSYQFLTRMKDARELCESNIIAEMLHLELQPYCVRALSVVTGTVQGMGQVGRFDEYDLPGNSLYKPIEGIMEELMTYCDKVVGETTDGRAKKFLCGGSAYFARLVASCIPGDHVVSKGTGLNALATEKKDN
ncbi:hypothetical protein BDW67DRAFT_172210 [Aspergillus spinulosporus]